MSAYRFLLADILTNEVYDELPLVDVYYSVELNRAGTFSARLPMSATNSVGYERVTAADIYPARRKVYVERDGYILAGFILWTAQANLEQGELVLGGEGIWSYFHRRYIRYTQKFTGVDQWAIVRTLIDNAQSQSGGDIGVVTQAASCGVTRDATYLGSEQHVVGEVIENMADNRRGFDFSIESAWESGAIVDRLVRYYPTRGTRRTEAFEPGTNINGLVVEVDGASMANRVDGLGAGTGPTSSRITKADTSMLGAYPLLEAAMTFGDIKRLTTLENRIEAELEQRKVPVTTATLSEVRADLEPMLGSYAPGDEFQLRVHEGWLDLDDWFRIMRYEVQIDEAGMESITIEMANADAFADRWSSEWPTLGYPVVG